MKILNNQSPFEKAYNKKPNYGFMHIFRCACWPNLRPYNRHKIDFLSKTCFFAGYSLSHQGYKCLDLSIGKIYVSWHVVFDESSFLYTKTKPTIYQSQPEIVSLPFTLRPTHPRLLTFHAGDDVCQSITMPFVLDHLPHTPTTAQ